MIGDQFGDQSEFELSENSKNSMGLTGIEPALQ